jgi:hypothetical protein
MAEATMRERRVVAIVGASLLVLVAGCAEVPYSNAMIVRVSPRAGHPPFEVTITVTGRDGGEYLFQLPDGDVSTAEPTVIATVDQLDWRGSVVWTRGDLRDVREFGVQTTNAPPVIGRPILAPYPEWILTPQQRTLLDFNFRDGGLHGTWSGIYDPDGDEWRIVSVTLQAPLKADPDSIFCAPYDGTYHATWRGQSIENACVVYPLYTGRHVGGLPCPPQGLTEAGYPSSPYQNPNLYYGQEFVEQVAMITVVAEDSWGAQSRQQFGIAVGALDYWDAPH